MGFLLLEDPKFSQINCLTTSFYRSFYIVSYNFHRQAVQKVPFSISELVHIRFLMHLLLFS